MNNQTLLRLPRLIERYGKARTSIWRDIKRGLLPRPVRTGKNTVVFPEAEINAVIQARVQGKTDEQIRALIEQLHAARVEAA